ncbi:MAG TPA: DUF1501 domain-containing protein, partial [Thermoanaerobaculia bacterium]|nr:DUF1501 domain-containing protein [Thermoanaerobaculia bacterium]
MSHSRRDFLVRTTCAALGAAALQGTVKKFGLANLLATPGNGVSSNYRALVCVFLQGGNDSNNMVIPTDSFYTSYASQRPTVSIPLGNVLPLAAPPASLGGRTFGFHPNMPEMVGLYNANKMAVVTNVGPLVEPMTQTEFINNTKQKPYSLFSHSDQVNAWESGRADIKISTGWGGRTADAVSTCNAGSGFPTITSIAGSTTFGIGLQRPLSIGTGSLTSVLVLNGFSNTATDQARLTSMNYLRTVDLTPFMIAGASSTTQQGVDIGSDFTTDPTLNTVFPNTGLGSQLKQVAKVIKLIQGSASLNLSRQIFFVQQGGYDTHQNQRNNQDANLLQLSQALNAFYNATVELGLQDSITTFTLSDFARTLQESGSGGNAGTDHGWGSHHFVVGDAVGGGNFYGTPNASTGSIFPTLQTGGPDDTTTSPTGGRGRWIPTSAADQYGGTLAKWLGVADIDMA